METVTYALSETETLVFKPYLGYFEVYSRHEGSTNLTKIATYVGGKWMFDDRTQRNFFFILFNNYKQQFGKALKYYNAYMTGKDRPKVYGFTCLKRRVDIQVIRLKRTCRSYTSNIFNSFKAYIQSKNFGYAIGVLVVLLTILTLYSALPNEETPKTPAAQVLQAPKKTTDTVTEINVNGKKVLYIGDSHTSNPVFGWQIQLAKQTGMLMHNTAVGGKMTPWMVNVAKAVIDTGFDYCFVYGGTNDCYSSRDPKETLRNLQLIADCCAIKNVKCYILTGADPLTTIRTTSNYPHLYDTLQKMMITDLKNCTVIDCRKAIIKENCQDWVCHMNYEGHLNLANYIINTCKFKRV